MKKKIEKQKRVLHEKQIRAVKDYLEARLGQFGIKSYELEYKESTHNVGEDRNLFKFTGKHFK